MSIKIPFKFIDPNHTKFPLKKGTPFAAGWDIPINYAPMFLPYDGISLESGVPMLLPTNLSLEIPEGYEGIVCSRSSTFLKKNIYVYPGTIDSDYRGELMVGVRLNHFGVGNTPDIIYFRPGDYIAQLKIRKVLDIDFVEVDNLSETERGNKGFGSTG